MYICVAPPERMQCGVYLGRGEGGGMGRVEPLERLAQGAWGKEGGGRENGADAEARKAGTEGAQCTRGQRVQSQPQVRRGVHDDDET